MATQYGIENQRETAQFWKDFKIILSNFVESNERIFDNYDEKNVPIYFVLSGLISIIQSKNKMFSPLKKEQNTNIKSFEKFFLVKEQRLDAYNLIVNFAKEF